jgi:transcriptional regulator with XRE-family HTH domain
MSYKFHSTLKKLRIDRGLTQSQLSDSLGLNGKQTISDYENGKSQPNIETLIKIADFFNISCDYLLGRDYNSSIIQKENLELKTQYKRLEKKLNQIMMIVNEEVEE